MKEIQYSVDDILLEYNVSVLICDVKLYISTVLTFGNI